MTCILIDGFLGRKSDSIRFNDISGAGDGYLKIHGIATSCGPRHSLVTYNAYREISAINSFPVDHWQERGSAAPTLNVILWRLRTDGVA